MAIKTFTTGEVLTAADTNTYLANSGLVYVKTHSGHRYSRFERHWWSLSCIFVPPTIQLQNMYTYGMALLLWSSVQPSVCI
jgi:hypothetical protein